MSATNLVNDIKVAWLMATGTIGSGLGTVLEMIPNDIGKLATLVGIILSSVLIYTHFRKGRIEWEKTHLEILILKEKEAERIRAANLRKEAGLPANRREDDGA
tara:strand:+ start:11853 stop:12161 length:309 start_codon:yes stop_codon:yes gene_type:complete